MQTIVTKFLNATNHRPARVIARSAGGSKLTLNAQKIEKAVAASKAFQGVHAATARKLALDLGWKGVFVEGALGAYGDKVWVCVAPRPISGLHPAVETFTLWEPTDTADRRRGLAWLRSGLRDAVELRDAANWISSASHDKDAVADLIDIADTWAEFNEFVEQEGL